MCTCKATSLSKMARLVWRYSDDAELLLKTCTSSAWRKRILEWNCHWIVYGTGLQHSLALADLPLRKLWKRRRHRTSSNNQRNHRHLRRKCHWMTLIRVLYGGSSPACTHWRRFCQPLIPPEQSSNRVLVTLAARVVFAKISFIWSLLNQNVLMERQDVVLSRIRYLRRVRELRETEYTVIYTDETYVYTSHAVPKCLQDSTTGIKIPFSKGILRILELYDPWVCTRITIWVRPLVRPLAVRENVHSSWQHSIFWSHFACICHSLTTGMLNHFIMEEGFIQIGQHSTLAVHFTVCWFHFT